MDAKGRKAAWGAVGVLLLLATGVANAKMAIAAMDEGEETAARFEAEKEAVFEELRRKFDERYPEK